MTSLRHPLPASGLPPETLTELTAELSARHPTSAARFVSHLVSDRDPAAALGRHVETVVFGETFGNGPALLAEEYAEHEAHSVFAVTLDLHRQTVAGTFRLIVTGSKLSGLKSLADLAAAPWHTPPEEVLDRMDPDQRPQPGRTWDAATLAVLRDYRSSAVGPGVAFALYQTVHTAAAAAGCLWAVAILDERPLELVQRSLRRPFQPYPGIAAGRYLDSPSSLPVWADLARWRAETRQAAPELYRTVVEGAPFDPTFELAAFAALPTAG